jgi:protein-histidine pros-kinase
LVKCLTWLAVVFVLVFAALNVLLSATVVRPVTELAALADRVSLGKLDGPDFPATGRDEVSLLAASFNRMKTSVIHALSLLDEATMENRR